MKTERKKREVETFAAESKAFTIKANGKAFRVLIDGLYADKIQSITREIWSNALDAHIMAGCPEKPFEVTFPTRWDCAFRVRDFGISLDHEQVMTLYSTLFESTKEDTNDQVGKFGLGSKSPFAYTDTFSVTVWKDGMKRYYATMINEDDIPTVNFMGEEVSDEPDGVEVSFPVKECDMREFQNAARRVSFGFDVKPIVDDPDFAGWPEFNPDINTTEDGWFFNRHSTPEGFRSGAHARMGCVWYPIDVEALGLDSSDPVYTTLKQPVFIDFEMGDLDITASREALSYGKGTPTVDSILSRITEIEKEIAGRLREDLKKCENVWETMCYIDSLNVPHFRNDRVKALLGDTKVDGVPLPPMNPVLSTPYGYYGMAIGKVKGGVIRHNFKAEDRVTIHQARSTVLVVERRWLKEDTKRISDRLVHLRNTHSQVIHVRVEKDDEAWQVYLRDFLYQYDGIAAYYADELPMPARPAAQRSPVKLWATNDGRFDRDAWRILPDEMEDEDGPFYYVPVVRNEPDTDFRAHELATLFEQAKRIGACSDTLYGIPKTLMKMVDGDDRFIPFEDHIHGIAKGLQDEVFEDVMRETVYDEVMNIRGVMDFYRRDGLLAHAPFQQLQEALTAGQWGYKCAEGTDTKSQIVSTVLGNDPDMLLLKDLAKNSAEVHAVREEMANIKERYPLLHTLMDARVKDVDIISNYVSLADIVSKNHNADVVPLTPPTFAIAAE